MFNVTVIRLKDIIKYPIIIVIAIVIVYFPTKYFLKNKEKVHLGDTIKSNISKYITYPINNQLSVIEKTNKEEPNEEGLIDENNDNEDREFMSYMLDTAFKLEFSISDVKELNDNNTETDIIEQENGEAQEEIENDEISLASNNEKTKIITKNPVAETYTDKYKGVKIKNSTDFKLTDETLNPENLDINNKNILIFHTHTCESYTQSEKYQYKASGNFRTTDLNCSVAKVGDELQKYLSKYDFNVIHDKTYHDYPAYNGSYTRSLSTVTKLLEKNKSDIIIDLHRDAIGSNSSYDPTVKIGNDECAQVMFVIRD